MLIFGAAFAAEIRAAIAAAFPGHTRTIIGGTVVVMIAAALVLAARRIGGPVRGPVGGRRGLRYLALSAAIVVGALFARRFGSGDADVDVVESFHFIEYGVLTLLFYRAWRPIDDPSVFVLPALAALLVGTLDEWLQWFVPSRVGEMRDVVLNGVAIACGLLFSVGVSPPAHFTLLLRRGSAMRLGSAAIVVIVVLAMFFQTIHLGHNVGDLEIGTFRSRYSRAQLESEAKARTGRWREEARSALGRLSREDQYVAEGLWHVRRRNQAVADGDMFTAWRENRILETFYTPLLEAGRDQSATGFGWPAEQRAQAARIAGNDRGPYASDAAPMPIYEWSKPVFWMVVALAVTTILGISVSAGKKEQPGS